MTASPVTKLYSTEDCKIAQLLADTGGSGVYATPIDIPGIQQVGLKPEIESKQLRGDNRELDDDSTLVAVTVTWTQAKLSYPALAVFLGGTWDGTSFVRVGSDYMPQWKMYWKTPTSGGDDIGGDVHFGVTKCRITDYQLGTAFQDYQLMSGTARGVYRLADDKLFELIPHTTSTALSTTSA